MTNDEKLTQIFVLASEMLGVNLAQGNKTELFRIGIIAADLRLPPAL